MIFDFLRKRKWVQDIVPEMQGAFGSLQVSVKNFPCQVDKATGERKFAYLNFGHEFITALTDRELGNMDRLRQTLEFGAARSVSVKLRDYQKIDVALRGKASPSNRQLASDIADVLIAAFQSKDIKP